MVKKILIEVSFIILLFILTYIDHKCSYSFIFDQLYWILIVLILLLPLIFYIYPIVKNRKKWTSKCVIKLIVIAFVSISICIFLYNYMFGDYYSYYYKSPKNDKSIIIIEEDLLDKHYIRVYQVRAGLIKKELYSGRSEILGSLTDKGSLLVEWNGNDKILLKYKYNKYDVGFYEKEINLK